MRRNGQLRVKFMYTLLEQPGDGWRVVEIIEVADGGVRWHSMVANVT